jgi:hypothetical protein
MSFAEELKKARSGRTAILHEFSTNYNPNDSRVHVFFEGHDDAVFYRVVLERFVKENRKLYMYRCDGKARVYEAFRQIGEKFPSCRGALFFVDKDLDDIVGQPWPTDPRIFVTDVYSIENYIVSRDVLNRVVTDFVKFRDVHFQMDPILDRFDRELQRFHTLITPLMAWIVVARRAGLRPMLSDIQLNELFNVSECSLKVRPGPRIEYLNRVTAASLPGKTSNRVLQVVRELKRLPPKRFVRGKFEMWFFIEFLQGLVHRLEAEAREVSGSVKLRTQIGSRNLVEILSGRIDVPPSLLSFLELHFPSRLPEPRKSTGFLSTILSRIKAAIIRGSRTNQRS